MSELCQGALQQGAGAEKKNLARCLSLCNKDKVIMLILVFVE